MTGTSMRMAAPWAAWVGDLPCSDSVTACSPTMMASSTRMPSTRIKPSSEIALMVCPVAHIKTKVASSEIGTPIATQNATRVLRKNSSTRTMIAIPDSALIDSVSMRSATTPARTSKSCASTVGGSRASRSSM